MKIKVSAPGKLVLFGEHAVVYGKPCIGTAVDRRLHVAIELIQKKELILQAPDVGIQELHIPFEHLSCKKLPKNARFIGIAFKTFIEQYPQKFGVHVKTESAFSAQYGLGSSSAVTAAFLHALCILNDVKITKKQLFDLCYSAIIQVQGVGSGFDIAAAIWGGTIRYVKPARVVEPLIESVSSNLPFIVTYSGVKADTPTLIRDIAFRFADDQKGLYAIFDSIEQITEDAWTFLKEKNWQSLGQCMNKNQLLLSQLGISSSRLDLLIAEANKNGAYGAKLSGAGGGDCMLSLVSEEKKRAVMEALTNASGIIVDTRLGAEGIRVEV